MTTLQRLTVPAINSLFITSALLYLMFSLIKTQEPELAHAKIFKLPVISSVLEEEPPSRIEPEERIEVTIQPQLENRDFDYEIGPITGPSWADPVIRGTQDILVAPIDSQLVLALGYPPIYPQNLVQRGVEGYAVVGFSVNSAGAVFDAFIIESEPGTVFDRAALKSIKKFKYKPRMVNGKAVSTDGQRFMFSYKIDKQN